MDDLKILLIERITQSSMQSEPSMLHSHLIASKKDAEIQLAKAERFQALVTEYFKNKGIY